jgi:hypothetical protein
LLLTRDGFIFSTGNALLAWGLVRAFCSNAVSVMWCQRLVSVTHAAFADKVTANAPAAYAARARASLQHNQTISAVSDRLRTAIRDDGYVFGAPVNLVRMHVALPSAASGRSATIAR